MKLESRPRPFTVFATARFSRTRSIDGREARLPASEVHAKTMGTTTTLCGMSALSWFKFFDVPFVSVRADRCPRCTDTFQRRLAAGNGN